MLRAVIVPERGGDTLWSSMTAAYEGLSPRMREMLDGLTAVHDFAHGFRASLAEPGGRERLAEAVAVLGGELLGQAQRPPPGNDRHPVERVGPGEERGHEGVPRLVFTSTPSVVHTGRDIEGLDESLPYARHFKCPYAETKAEAERRVLVANGPALATVALRPHLVWGPGDTQLIPRILERALTLRPRPPRPPLPWRRRTETHRLD